MVTRVVLMFMPPSPREYTPSEHDHRVTDWRNDYAADKASEKQWQGNLGQHADNSIHGIKRLSLFAQHPSTQPVLPVKDEWPREWIGDPNHGDCRRHVETGEVGREARGYHLEGNWHHGPEQPRSHARSHAVSARKPEAGGKKFVPEQSMQPGAANVSLARHFFDPSA